MTTAPATATSSYYIGIPIGAAYSVTLNNLPSGLSREEVLALLTPDMLSENGELCYPMKHREEVWEAVETINGHPADIDIDEDPNED